MYTFAKSTELPNMLVLRKTPDNSEIRLEKTGKSGGESEIYGIVYPNYRDAEKYAAKIYRNEKFANAKEDKILAMMNILKQRLNVVSMADFVEMFLAVPRARLYYADGSFAGFIMTSYFDQQIISMEEFVEGKYRSYSEPNAWHAKIVVSSNLLRVCAVAHSLVMTLVDLNSRNLLVRKDGGVILIDVDSAQLNTGTKVFEPDAVLQTIAAPEILNSEPITTKTDSFALGIMLYRIFMMGFSPFQFIGNDKDEREIGQIILACTSPLRDRSLRVPFGCPDLSILGPLEGIISRCIDPEPQKRPSLGEIHSVIEAMIHSRKHCKKGHMMPNHLNKCLTCGESTL